ncbi:MAG: uncharacterized protein A8A55_2367, partial [Amphiamblys sp. WSBS2006]
MSPQTLPSLELRPDMEVETAAEITRQTKVVLDNITVTDALFLWLMSKTAVEVRNTVSLVGHGDTLDWCIGELDAITYNPTRFYFDGYTDEEMKQVYENIKTTPGKSIRINAEKIYAAEDGVYFLLKTWTGAGGCSPDLSLETTKKEHIEEFLKEENNSICVGKVKSLSLKGYAVEALPKLRIHGENVMEEGLRLDADKAEQITEVLKTENNSIWVGKMKRLELYGYTVGILPKLKIHEDNVIEELWLNAYDPINITEILKTENNSIWVGKVKRLVLDGYAVYMLPKLRFHKEHVMDELELNAYEDDCITGIPRMENKSIWAGKVKKLELKGYAVRILPQLRIHEENMVEEFVLATNRTENLAEILEPGNKNILAWIAKVHRLSLKKNAIQLLPKLRIHEENVMEVLELDADRPEDVAEILKEENNSIWVGKVKRLQLIGYVVGILPKLRMHEENVMELLVFYADKTEHIPEILKTENNSIWVGKVKRLEISRHALGILPKLRMHEDNVMEVLELDADRPEDVAEILKEENNSIWVGKVKLLKLEWY